MRLRNYPLTFAAKALTVFCERAVRAVWAPPEELSRDVARHVHHAGPGDSLACCAVVPALLLALGRPDLGHTPTATWVGPAAQTLLAIAFLSDQTIVSQGEVQPAEPGGEF